MSETKKEEVKSKGPIGKIKELKRMSETSFPRVWLTPMHCATSIPDTTLSPNMPPCSVYSD